MKLFQCQTYLVPISIYSGEFNSFIYKGMLECLRGMLSSFFVWSTCKSLQMVALVFDGSMISSMNPRWAATIGFANRLVYSLVCRSRSFPAYNISTAPLHPLLRFPHPARHNLHRPVNAYWTSHHMHHHKLFLL